MKHIDGIVSVQTSWTRSGCLWQQRVAIHWPRTVWRLVKTLLQSWCARMMLGLFSSQLPKRRWLFCS